MCRGDERKRRCKRTSATNASHGTRTSQPGGSTGMDSFQTLYTWNAVGVRLFGRVAGPIGDRYPLRTPEFWGPPARPRWIRICLMMGCFNVGCACCSSGSCADFLKEVECSPCLVFSFGLYPIGNMEYVNTTSPEQDHQLHLVP